MSDIDDELTHSGNLTAIMEADAGIQKISELEENAISEMALLLQHDIEKIITDRFEYDIWYPNFVSSAILTEVAREARLAMLDLRNKYPHGISAAKYLSSVVFWLVKLKPICTTAFQNRKTGTPVDLFDINERVAVSWCFNIYLDLAEEGLLSELIMSKKENIDKTLNFFGHYMKKNIYRNSEGAEVENTQKYRETVFNLRYKKFTSVNIYEMLVHSLLPYKLSNEAWLRGDS